jgi:hypothetical protein
VDDSTFDFATSTLVSADEKAASVHELTAEQVVTSEDEEDSPEVVSTEYAF